MKISTLQACIITFLIALIVLGLDHYIISIPRYICYILITISVVGISTIFVWNYFKHRTSKPTNVQDIAPDDAPQASEEPLPDFITADTIEKLREKSGVRPLRDTENELSLYHLPKGVFGWIESYKLNTPQFWIKDSLLGPDHPGLPLSTKLFQKKRFSSAVEIHKTETGALNIVAFVSEESRIFLENPSRREAIKVVLVFRNYKNYDQTISIPRDRLKHWESRSFGDNEPVADVWVA